jgi:hypothetical protein
MSRSFAAVDALNARLIARGFRSFAASLIPSSEPLRLGVRFFCLSDLSLLRFQS